MGEKGPAAEMGSKQWHVGLIAMLSLCVTLTGLELPMQSMQGKQGQKMPQTLGTAPASNSLGAKS